jgi:hypothetical protein
MERAAWTDERLDDLASRMDAGFERVGADIRDLRQTVLQVGGATIGTLLVGFLGVLAAILTSA